MHTASAILWTVWGAVLAWTSISFLVGRLRGIRTPGDSIGVTVFVLACGLLCIALGIGALIPHR